MHIEFVHRNRKNGKGGGVGIYLRNSLKWNRRQDLENEHVENIWIEINIPKSSNILLGVYYRPPNTSKFLSKDFDNILNETLQSATDEKKEIILMGDLNVNYLSKTDNKNIKELLSLYGLTQLINVPTRTTQDSSSLIDIIAANNESSIVSTNVFPLSIGDHDMIGCVRKINNGKFKPKVITSRNYKNYNPDEMIKDFEKVDWNVIYGIQDVNTALTFFNSIVKQIFDKHAPVTVKRARGKPCRWLNSDLKKLMKDRDRVLEKARKSKKDEDWRVYRTLRNSCNNQTKAAKRSYHRNLLDENAGSPKGFWKCIKSIFPTKTATSLGGNNKSQNFVDKCSTYFCNAVSKLKGQVILLTNFVWKTKQNFRRRTAKTFNFVYVSNVFITKQLKSLKRNKSAGIDGFPPGMLKDCHKIISQPLRHIINLSLNSGIVPSSWKIAKVVPIYKKGTTTDPANYRPISVLPVLSKVLEKAVHCQLMDYLEDENLLTDRQFGYRRKRSTNLATTLLLDSIKMQVGKGLLVGATFIDLSKAFDTISHAKILDKLPSYGILGQEREWMTDYLFARKQYEQIDEYTSNLQPCLNGVPQGSILGPLLFLIFFNDFTDHLQKTNAVMYADDSVIYCSGKSVSSIEEDLNSDLESIKAYFDANELVINMNVGKTEVMLYGTAKRISSQPRPLNLLYNQQKVNNTNCYTYLGHRIESTLTLASDFEYAYKRVAARLKLLSKLRS